MYFVFPVVCACAAVVQLIITVAIAAAKPDFNTDFFIFTSCFNVCVYSFLFLDIHLSFIDMQMYILFLYHQRKTRKNYRNSIKIYPFSLFVGMKEDEDVVFMCLG